MRKIYLGDMTLLLSYISQIRNVEHLDLSRHQDVSEMDRDPEAVSEKLISDMWKIYFGDMGLLLKYFIQIKKDKTKMSK